MMLIQANITKNFTKPVEINYSQFLITYSIALLIYVLILVSAVYVLKHKELWRKVLIYSLIFLILALLISPIINYTYSPTVKLQVENVNDYGMVDTLNKTNLLWFYVWSILLSLFYVFVIVKLSKTEIKTLFN